ncbi:MAG: hypothetical protein J2P34_09720, partial [Actinobacteria bacterium]|nr:hypothetical protein [Actinomycetota bacterium]
MSDPPVSRRPSPEPRPTEPGPAEPTPPEPGHPHPSAAALRRALARARDGKPLDEAEATTLLHARGADLDALLA